MRGSSLSHPDVVSTLRPFILVSWNGTSTRDFPEDVGSLYRQARLSRDGGPIRLFVLNPAGQLEAAFFPFAGQSPATLGFDSQRMGTFLKQEIQKASAGMDLSKTRMASRQLKLPTLALSESSAVSRMPAGVRILLSLEHPFSKSYRVPVIETVAANLAEEKVLQYPQTPRQVSAQSLKRWLEQLYPPGMMERSGRIIDVQGELLLKPAGEDRQDRYAILQGTVYFTFDDARKTRYEGSVAIAFRYAKDAARMKSFRGVYRGLFPKQDKYGKGEARILMQAVLESLPRLPDSQGVGE